MTRDSLIKAVEGVRCADSTEEYGLWKDRILACYDEQRKEIARLTDIITRESWLEWANENDAASPYVPWDQYAGAKAEIGDLTHKLNTLELACGAAVQDAAAKTVEIERLQEQIVRLRKIVNDFNFAHKLQTLTQEPPCDTSSS